MTYEGKTAQGETGMTLLQPFGASPLRRNVGSGPHSYISREPRDEVFFCDAPGCVLTFRNENEAQDHMDTGTHQLVLERETVYDTIRRKCAQHVTGIASRSAESSKSARPPDSNLSSCSDDNLSVQGWALKGQKTAAKTSEKVKEFLITKFNEGVLGRKKANPVEVSEEMQDAKDSKGLALFSPEEWKTSRQINSFFSRLSALQKSKEAHPVTVGEEENLTDDDVSTWEGHSFEQNLRYEVYEAVDLQRPLSFEDRDICKIAKGGKLKNLKVVELKNICKKFALTTVGNQERKRPYIDAIEEFVKSCSCRQ